MVRRFPPMNDILDMNIWLVLFNKLSAEMVDITWSIILSQHSLCE